MDVESCVLENPPMDKPCETPIYLERIDASRNMARFYAMFVQPTLFGELSLIRNWGRIGARGRSKVETFPDREGLVMARLQLARKKRGRGYVEGRAQ